MSTASAERSRPVGFALFSIVAGLIGWFASFKLLTEYLHTLTDPGYEPGCNVSLLVSCGPNMGSWQGSVLGFSNTIIGVSAFVAPIAVGVALIAGARFDRWFWWLYRAGLLLGIGFVFWLAYQSVFDLHVLCPWCMIVWLVTIPLFWVTAFHAPPAGMLPVPDEGQRRFEALRSWSWVFILFSYLLIAVVAQVRLDWFAEIERAWF